MSESDPPAKPVVTSGILDSALSEITDLLIEEETCNVVLNRGKHLRYNTVDHVAYFAEIQPGTEQVDSPVLDIFGQVLHKKSNFECECPKCHRALAAARFAPHLEKCMGMGRNSSRIASRRLAASASSCNSSSSSAAAGLAGTSDIARNSAVATNASSAAGAQITNIGEVVSEDEHFEDDGDDDEDWTMEKKKKKKGVEKSAPKRIK